MARSRSPFRHRHHDLFHAFILLATVPLLFFAALKLVGQSTDVIVRPDSDRTQTDSQKSDGSSSDGQPQSKSLPPGVDWLNEITDLEQRLVGFRSNPSIASERIETCQQRVAILRQFIEQHQNSVPKSLDPETRLGSALKRLRDDVDQLSPAGQVPVAGFDWQKSLGQFETQQRQDYQTELKTEIERETTPLKKTQQEEINGIQNDLQKQTVQIQAIHEQELVLQARTDRELARLARLQAFEPVRNEVRRLLLPFISHDYFQLDKADFINWTKTLDKKPMSLKAIERLGALEPTLKGIETLSQIGTQTGRNPEFRRPLGSFPEPDGGSLSRPHDIEATKRAQQLLKEHGQALVEEGLLSP